MTVTEMLREKHAASDARRTYREAAARLDHWAREALQEGWSQMAVEYWRMSKIAAKAADTEGR